MSPDNDSPAEKSDSGEKRLADGKHDAFSRRKKSERAECRQAVKAKLYGYALIRRRGSLPRQQT